MLTQAQIDLGYVPHDREVVFHNDPDERRLRPIHIPLPEPPPLEEIDGYGLPAEMQMFERAVMPKRLLALQNKKVNGEPMSIEDIYEILQNEQSKYRVEIEWIKKQWKRRIHGYWFFCHGKPTYIDGWHYVFLNSWYVGSADKTGLPFYRDRDRKWFIGLRYFYQHPNIYGVCYPKHRREGATFRSQCVGYCIITEGFERHGTIQSMTEKHAKEVYEHKVKVPWSKMWFFWKPISKGGTNPMSGLEFVADRVLKRGKTLVNSGVESLGGTISPFPSGEKAVDGMKVHFCHQDEVGKKDRETFDVVERWKVTRECLGEGFGSVIFGLALLTSTVEDMETGGGKEFWEIAKSSMYHETGEHGRTNSGLVNLFMPAWEALSDEYVDEYGASIIEDPIKPVRNCIGKMQNQGARKYILGQFEDLIKAEDWAGLASAKRKYPTNFMMCFTASGKATGFNIEVLTNRLEWYEYEGKAETKRGYFRWVNGKRFGKVEFVPSINRPKFIISYEPPHHQRNQVMWNQASGSYEFITKGFFVACGDPVKFGKTDKGIKSNGAGAVFRMRDYVVDPDGTPLSKMQSHKFCCTYDNAVNNRNDYLEDMLMMCWYYGAPMYPEANVPALNDYFIDHKCNELLLYDINQHGQRVENAGYHVGESNRNEIFAEYMNYIDTYGAYEKHGDLLKQCLNIQGPEDMTNYDLFAAGGGCFLALKNRIIRYYNRTEVEENFNINIPVSYR